MSDIQQIFREQLRQRLTELRSKNAQKNQTVDVTTVVNSISYKKLLELEDSSDSESDDLSSLSEFDSALSDDEVDTITCASPIHPEPPVKPERTRSAAQKLKNAQGTTSTSLPEQNEVPQSTTEETQPDEVKTEDAKQESNPDATLTKSLYSRRHRGRMWDRMYTIAEMVAHDIFDVKNEEALKTKVEEFEVKVKSKLKERKTKVQQYFQKNSKISDVNRRLKSQIWSSVVTLVLVEGKNLPALDPDSGLADLYVKFRLGNEKYKSRVFWRSTSPRWLEQFDLHLYDDGDQQLEVTVWDKEKSRDDYIGRCVIDLSQMEREKTQGFWQDLEECAGSLYFLLTISGTTASETISDLTTYEENPQERVSLEARYAWHQTFTNVRDVGHLTVKVFRATGLAAADLGGKSDPFCVLELGNARLQTQTEYKTLAPSWNKIFTFNVKDINNILEITVYDEDRDHKVEFLGKLAIPLLKIRNGDRRWFPLKDKKLRSRAKGANPQILIEMNVVWNPIRACIRTLNPREEKYMQPEVKFKRQVFVRNVLRLKAIAMHFIELGKLLQNCFEWESTLRSFIALLFWLVLCYYFEPFMLPTFGLLYFLKQYIVNSLTGGQTVTSGEGDDSDLDDDEEDGQDKEEKKSLKERLQAIQEVTQSVQNYIGFIASLGESVKNTFNFTVPYLSWIAILMLLAAAIVLYFIPIRYLLMLWGINKFVRRLVRPHSVPNNEVLDLLSRVPDDEMLLDFRELKTLPGPDQPDRRKDQRKKHKVS